MVKTTMEEKDNQFFGQIQDVLRECVEYAQQMLDSSGEDSGESTLIRKINRAIKQLN